MHFFNIWWNPYFIHLCKYRKNHTTTNSNMLQRLNKKKENGVIITLLFTFSLLHSSAIGNSEGIDRFFEELPCLGSSPIGSCNCKFISFLYVRFCCWWSPWNISLVQVNRSLMRLGTYEDYDNVWFLFYYHIENL